VCARSSGIETELLTVRWPGAVVDKQHGSIQEQCRMKRYDLLSTACDERGINVLVTGHHIEDQAETFLMRLSRRSGITGCKRCCVCVDAHSQQVSVECRGCGIALRRDLRILVCACGGLVSHTARFVTVRQ
jgi:tRNA(Ile)-lysidine synthase TilS/MesJ